MKPFISVLALFLSFGASAFANHHEEAADAYPLTTCVVSDEPLGEMGDVVYYTYKADGQSDREVRFCCKMCIARFKKDPASYLAKIDAAAALQAHAHTDTTASAKSCCDEDKCAACEAKTD